MDQIEHKALLDIYNTLKTELLQIELLLQGKAPEPEPPEDGVTIDKLREKVDLAVRSTSPETVLKIFKSYGHVKLSDFLPEQYENLSEVLDEAIESASKKPVEVEE